MRAQPEGPTLAQEFDPDEVWQNVCGTATACLRDAGVTHGQVAAVTATSQRQSVVFLDRNGGVLYAGPNTDLRAVFEGAAIDHRMRDRVYNATGHVPSMLLVPAKMTWFRDQRREAYDRIATVFSLADWLVWKLSGVAAAERTLACEAGLLDLRRRDWCTDLLDELGHGVAGLPPLVAPGTAVGKLTRTASRDTGIPDGTTVVAAGADTQCGLLGVSAAEPRQVGIVAGWSAPVQMVTDQPVLHPQAKTWAGCFGLDAKWVLESTAGDAGNSYRWLADTVFGGGEDAFAKMDGLASKAPVGSDGAMVVMGPSRMDMSRLGLRRGGLLFPVPVAFGGTGQAHLARAAQESVAYTLRANLEQAEQVAADSASSIALGGGFTQSPSFAEIVASVIGRRLLVSPTPNVSALGAFLCAATALGDYSTLLEASQSVRPDLVAVDPDPAIASEYQDHYEGWLEAARPLADIPL